MNIQERIEALETEFAEKIKTLKAEAQREKEFPQYGDTYWYVGANGRIFNSEWDGLDFEEYRLKIDNVFKTKEQAEFAVEKLKVEAELRKFSKPFKEDGNNYFMVLDMDYESIDIWDMSYSKLQETIYFESEEKAQQAVSTVGVERIKKYIFGVED